MFKKLKEKINEYMYGKPKTYEFKKYTFNIEFVNGEKLNNIRNKRYTRWSFEDYIKFYVLDEKVLLFNNEAYNTRTILKAELINEDVTLQEFQDKDLGYIPMFIDKE